MYINTYWKNVHKRKATTNYRKGSQSEKLDQADIYKKFNKHTHHEALNPTLSGKCIVEVQHFSSKQSTMIYSTPALFNDIGKFLKSSFGQEEAWRTVAQ